MIQSRKLKFLYLFILLIIFITTKKVTAQSGYLCANGTKIIDGNNKDIILKGIGLGGWMLQEGYMLGTTGAQHEIRAYFEEMAGINATDKFYEDWLRWFVAKKDVQLISKWGYNSVRLPIHYNLFFDKQGNWIKKSKGLELTDKLLLWCKQNKLYLILDLHAAPGGQGNEKGISDRHEGESLWIDDKARSMTLLMWYKLAEKYKNEKWIGGYDLINEPNYDFENSGNSSGCACKKNVPLQQMFESIIDTIRLVDKNHLLIVEGNCYGGNYSGMTSLGNYDKNRNLAFSFHLYWGNNSQQDIAKMVNLRDSLNIPIWRGEIGENSNTWFTDMVSLMEKNEIGYASWPWKKINSNVGPVNVSSVEEWDKLIAFKNNKQNPKPTQAEAQVALVKMIENIKLKNSKIIYDVTYAYRSSPYNKGSEAFAVQNIPGVIYTPNYDLGKYKETWFDTEYENKSGHSARGYANKGMSYRNDGVDIWKDTTAFSNGYYVGKIEDGEWLKFSLKTIKNDNYTVKMSIRNASQNEGKLMLSIDGKPLQQAAFVIPRASQWQELVFNNVAIPNGKVLTIDFIKGGFEISALRFVK